MRRFISLFLLLELVLLLLIINTSSAAAEIQYIYWSGQSLARGRQGTPPINTSQPFSPPNVKIWPKWYDTGIESASFVDLIADEPLTRGGGPANYEDPGIGMANTLRQLQGGASSPAILVDTHAVGGRCYAALKRGAKTPETYAADSPFVYPFDDAVGNHFGSPPRDPPPPPPNTLTRAKELAAAQGDTLSVLAIAITHGECDLGAQTAATYAGYLVDWRATFNQEASYVMGAPVDAPLFTSQFSSWGRAGLTQPVTSAGVDSTPIGHWYAARDNPHSIALVAPHYPFAYHNDALHLTADGYERLGGYYAKALNKWIAQGKIWRPVAPRSITYSGAEITARFHVPTPPLVFDATTVVNPGDYGFEVWRGATRLSLSSVTLVDRDTVRITAVEALDGTEMLRYAYTGCAGLTCSGPVNGPRGNLRDSDTTQIQRVPVELPNWAITFNEPVDGFVWDPDSAEQPLTISEVTAVPGETTATIAWTTNRGANSRVEYGTSPALLDRSAESPAIVTSHRVTLTGLTAARVYYFRVRSSDGVGTHAVSPGLPDSSAFTTRADTTPPVISGISVSPSATQALIQWTTDEPATGRIDYGTDAVNLNLQVSSPALALHRGLSLVGLATKTTYYYRVTSMDAAGNSAASPVAPLSLVTTSDSTPPVISAVTAVPEQKQATIAWTTNEQATARVEYGMSPTNLNLNSASPALAATRSLTITGLTQSSTYYYRVSSADARGNNAILPAPPAAPLTFATTGDITPPTISAIIVTPGSTSATIRWTTSESATSRVDYGSAPGALTLNVATSSRATTRTMTLTGLRVGATYYFRLTSADAVGNTAVFPAPPFPPLSFFTDATPPLISELTATPSRTLAAIRWTTNEPANSRVDYGLSPDALVLNVKRTSYGLTRALTLPLTPGTVYYYRVTSADAAGNTSTLPPALSPPLTFNTTAVPVSLTVLTGTAMASTPASLLAADSSHFQVASAPDGSNHVSEWYGSMPNIPLSTPGLSLTYKGGNTAPCSQTVAFWNWTLASWTVVDTRNVGPTEAYRSNLTPPGAQSAYIGGATKEVRVRLGCSGTLPFQSMAEYLWLTF